MKSVDFHVSIKRNDTYADAMDRLTDHFGVSIMRFIGKCPKGCCSNFVGRFRYENTEAFDDLMLFFEMYKDDYKAHYISTNAPMQIRDVFNEITRCLEAGTEVSHEILSQKFIEINEIIRSIRSDEPLMYDGENEVHQFFVQWKFIEINNNGALSVSEKGNVLFPEPPRLNPILQAIIDHLE